MNKLNFPEFDFNIQTESGIEKIFDTVRKKYVALTPEEWVRQHVIRYLTECKNYPKELLQVEGSIKVGRMKKRCDLIAYNKQLQPILLVECKRDDVEINQKVFDQICRYNLKLGVPTMLITNGINHCCFEINSQTLQVQFLQEIPDFEKC